MMLVKKMIANDNTVQSYWILNKAGANLDKAHEVFTIKYMYLIFKELNHELFESEEIVRPGPDKTYTVDKLLPFTGWAHFHNITSCRMMESLWKSNIGAVDFVLNCTKPSKSTIGSFILEYADLISEFDEFIKKFSINLGLYWDGTFIKANCNNQKKMYPAQILYLEEVIKKYYL